MAQVDAGTMTFDIGQKPKNYRVSLYSIQFQLSPFRRSMRHDELKCLLQGLTKRYDLSDDFVRLHRAEPHGQPRPVYRSILTPPPTLRRPEYHEQSRRPSPHAYMSKVRHITVLFPSREYLTMADSTMPKAQLLFYSPC